MSAPLVTGISPKEGIPGTKVTIRGENLGINAADIISLKICSVDCLSTLEYISDRKVVARTGRCIGKGDVILCTRSGGTGSSSVGFFGRVDKVGPLQECAYWVDEDIPLVVGVAAKSVPAGSLTSDLLGMQDFISQATMNDFSEAFRDESIDVTKQNFSPSLYLSKMKPNISFEDLKRGLSFLKSSEHIERSSTTLVKNNIISFMDAIDIISDVKENSISDAFVQSIESTEFTIDEILRKAHSMYDEDLDRKQQADSIRNSMNVLQRFKFLFYLPHNISRYIASEQYDKAINDYSRAKTLFEKTDVHLLNSVFKELDAEVEKLIAVLKNKLFEFPQSLDDQKSLIRYLKSLDCKEDLTRECIVKQHEWVVQQLKNCVNRLSTADKDKIETVYKETAESLCEVMQMSLKDLWKICSMFVNDESLSCESITDEVKAERVDFVGDMIMKTCRVFCDIIRDVYLNPQQKVDVGTFGENLLNKGDLLQSRINVLPYVTRVCRFTVHELNSFDIPNEVRTELLDLLMNLRSNCLSVILLKAAYDVAILYKEIDWSLKKDDVVGSYSRLPEQFESIFMRALISAREYALAFDKSKREKDLLSDRKINKNSQLLLYGVVAAFFSTFENIIATLHSDKSSNLSAERRCVILFNNLEYTHKVSFPRLEQLIISAGYKEANRIMTESSKLFEDCCVKVSKAFLKEAIDPCISLVEEKMYSGKFDWAENFVVKGVHSYVKHFILKVAGIHSEITGVSVYLTEKLLKETINVLCSQFLKLYMVIPKFSDSGALQANLDIVAVHQTFKSWLLNDTEMMFRKVLDVIPTNPEMISTPQYRDFLASFHEKLLLIISIFTSAD